LSPAVSTEIGGIIRRVRKRRRLRLEDLADENISPATISNLERGVPHVKQDKLDYLLDKLGISMDQIPELILEEKEELKNLKFQLFSCESLVSIGKPDNALEKLSQLEVEDTHPHAALYHYIQGKSYRSKKNWKKAERSLYQAVRIGSQTRSTGT
jgi:transcriptional regulator with XRE-family HTH domain